LCEDVKFYVVSGLMKISDNQAFQVSCMRP